MTKKAKITLYFSWVAKHKNDGIIGEILTKGLTNPEGYIVAKASLGLMTLFFNENITDEDKIKKDLDASFLSEFSEESSPYTISIADLDESDTKLLVDLLNDKYADKKDMFDDIDNYSDEASFERLKTEVDDMMKNLVGATEFKDLINEIVQIAPELKRKDTFDVFTNRCYLFSIGDGYGLSTYLQILSDVLKKIIDRDVQFTPVRETVCNKEMDMLDGYICDFGAPSDDLMSIVCIDISGHTDKINTDLFRRMFHIIENNNDLIVVFKVPFLEKYTLGKIEKDLSDILTIKTISIPPLTNEELRTYANSIFSKRGFTVNDSAWSFFDRKIQEEKSDGRFYGLKTVNKVVKEIIYSKQLENAIQHTVNDEISPENIQSVFRDLYITNLTGEEELAKLVGTDVIKEKVKEIIAQIEYATKTATVERPCIHMKFVGNPGTGKTTVARIIGKILYERGVLRFGNFYEHMSRDLCGKFIGETAPRTSSICRDALGSVLFIDEAYALYRGGDKDNKDYGREALDTLIAEMENHRDDLVVILAGYTDDMEILMNGNAGLRSRIPYTIEFPNFTRDQLFDIYMSLFENKFEYDEGLKECAKKYFDSIPDKVLNEKSFANARFVRNLFERTWAKASMRCQLEENPKITFTKDDFERASNEKEFKFEDMSKKSKIGF